VVDASGKVTASRDLDATALRGYQDVTDAVYRLRNTSGREQSQNVPWAVSLRGLVSTVPLAAGGTVDPASVTFVEVVDGNDLSHPLSGADLAPAGSAGFVDGEVPAVFINTDAGSAQYVRPLRSDDADDLNVTADPSRNGWVGVSAPDRLTVVVHTAGTLLSPTITASATRAKVRAPVTFAATFPSRPATSLSYSWDFRDGTGATTAAPSHVWAQSGTYYVNLTVRGADGSFGRAAAVLLSVSPVSSTSPSLAPGGTGTDTATTAPDTGPTSSKGKSHGGRASQHATAGASTGASSGSTTGASSGPSDSATTAPSPSPSASATRRSDPAPSTTGEVRGIVLLAAGQNPQSDPADSADSARAATEATALSATAAAARARADAGGWSGAGWVGFGAGIVVLLAAGMAAEARGGWRRLLRRVDGTMTP
jgi:PKD repeat protein